MSLITMEELGDNYVSSDWGKVELRNIADIRIGRTPARDTPDYWIFGEIPWVSIADLNYGKVSQTKECISQLAHEKVFREQIVPPGTILLSFKLTIGKVGILEIPAVHNEAIASLELKSDMVDRDFLFYTLQALDYSYYMDNYVKGKTLSKDKIESLPIFLPPLLEQRAIARVLQSTQEAIQTRRKELELEREYKAVLMQHLFTYGVRGNNLSDTRETQFGHIPTNWHVASLDECAIVQTGIAKGRKLEGQSVTLPYLRVANVQDGYLDLTEIKSIELQPSEVERYKLCPGDVVVTEGGDFDKLGRGFLWKGEVPDCVHQNHIFAIRSNRDILLPEYLAYLIQSKYGKAYFLSVAHKTTNLACINSTKLKAFPTLLPSLEEQQEIAVILQACDSKITALEKEIALHEELFRALLDELMTGKLSALPLVE